LSQRIQHYLREHTSVIEALSAEVATITSMIELCIQRLGEGNKIMICGNGGSAADAQHIAAELIGRFVGDRRALPAVALTTDTSALTAIANDYGYDAVFSRQVEGLGRAGDVLLSISTSGNSESITEASRAATALGMHTMALTGKGGGVLAPLVDLALVVPSEVTAHIQECHIVIGHLLCDGIERGLELV
jgi:D-sedoheptulose 7-phosphate isomerase